MARLIIKTEVLPNRTLQLRLGVNRIGRLPENEFQIEHTTVSSHHGEVVVTNEGVYYRDCESTNGSFLNGQSVTEPVWLQAGQELKLGDVELLVESTEINIAIPTFEKPLEGPPPAAIMEDGNLGCPQHPTVAAVFRCTHCGSVMCHGCVHVMKLKGGAPLFLCRLCSHKCERITLIKAAKKRSLLGFIQDTVKLKLGLGKDERDG